MLGGGESNIQSNVWSQPNTGEAGDRFITALTMAHKYPEAILLFNGGSGRLMGGASGSEIAQDIFLGAGLDKSRLILEGASRNTAENATMSLELVPDNLDGDWLLVTSAFHMRRASPVSAPRVGETSAVADRLPHRWLFRQDRLEFCTYFERT